MLPRSPGTFESTIDAKMRAERRRYLKVVKAFRCALAIIRNDAMCDEHHAKDKAKTRQRWCRELEVEAGVSKD